MMGKPCWGFQVFICHRGTDTKKTLASVLYTFLHQTLGFRVFLDQKALPTGKKCSLEIDAAIKTSSVHIIIFSPRFAESISCLKELCQILEHRDTSTIIAIFYDVETKALEFVNEGPYKQAFIKHRDKGRMEVHRWEQALKIAAEIEGIHTGKDNWGEVSGKIVDIVHENVKRVPLRVADHPVGLDKVGEDLRKIICKQMEASPDTITIVGIAGLGGSGKTTLVTHLCNLMRSDFKWFSFLRDVSGSKLISLQAKLLSDLRGNPQPHIWNTTDGKSLLQRLKGLSQVLIVIDGINHKEQIENLLSAVKDVLGAGSLIVITSRDKDLLTTCKVILSYDMKLLNENDAQELFCHYASRESNENVVRKMVKMCGGYPLALIDLGKNLSSKTNGKSQLEMLPKKQFLTKMVQEIVKPSYAALEEEAKVVFLKLASFFERSDFHLVVRVEGKVECPLLDWIEDLGNKCLVEFHSFEVDVHGQVKYNNDGEHEDLQPHKNRRLKKRRLITPTPCRVCKIGMSEFVKDLAKIIASEEHPENQMISSDYQISDWLQKLPMGITASKGKGKVNISAL